MRLKVRTARERVFLREVRTKIPPVMTELYRDPILITLPDMLYIARDKREGKSVDTALGTARQEAA